MRKLYYIFVVICVVFIHFGPKKLPLTDKSGHKSIRFISAIFTIGGCIDVQIIFE